MIEFTVYRVLIELINNTLKYGSASKISIKLELKQETLKITYSDNGKGFNYENKHELKHGFGLMNMETRIKKLDGEFSYRSSEGKGVHVEILFNINKV